MGEIQSKTSESGKEREACPDAQPTTSSSGCKSQPSSHVLQHLNPLSARTLPEGRFSQGGHSTLRSLSNRAKTAELARLPGSPGPPTCPGSQHEVGANMTL